jgi:hypothetical protein
LFVGLDLIGKRRNRDRYYHCRQHPWMKGTVTVR